MASFFTVAQCEAMLTALYNEQLSLAALPQDTMDTVGTRITEKRLAEINAAIEVWLARRDDATANSDNSQASAIKLIRRQPV